jgi:hypothetical protein
MPGSPKHMETDPASKSAQATYQVMYLAKRPSYEFSLAIPEGHPLSLSADQALFQLRLKDRPQAYAVVLTLDELEDFYDKLSQLVAYIKAERERRSRHL